MGDSNIHFVKQLLIVTQTLSCAVTSFHMDAQPTALGYAARQMWCRAASLKLNVFCDDKCDGNEEHAMLYR